MLHVLNCRYRGRSVKLYEDFQIGVEGVGVANTDLGSRVNCIFNLEEWWKEKRYILRTVLHRNTILFDLMCDYAPMHFLLEIFHVFLFKNKKLVDLKVQNKALLQFGKNASNWFSMNIFLIRLT